MNSVIFGLLRPVARGAFVALLFLGLRAPVAATPIPPGMEAEVQRLVGGAALEGGWAIPAIRIGEQTIEVDLRKEGVKATVSLGRLGEGGEGTPVGETKSFSAFQIVGSEKSLPAAQALVAGIGARDDGEFFPRAKEVMVQRVRAGKEPPSTIGEEGGESPAHQSLWQAIRYMVIGLAASGLLGGLLAAGYRRRRGATVAGDTRPAAPETDAQEPAGEETVSAKPQEPPVAG